MYSPGNLQCNENTENLKSLAKTQLVTAELMTTIKKINYNSIIAIIYCVFSMATSEHQPLATLYLRQINNTSKF